MISTIILTFIALVLYLFYIMAVLTPEDETERIKSIEKHREYIRNKNKNRGR